MPEPNFALEPMTAIGYLGQTVSVELYWEGDEEVLRHTFHLVGVVLPVPGVLEHGCFLAIPTDGGEELPVEIYFDYVKTIRIIGDSIQALDALPLQQKPQG